MNEMRYFPREKLATLIAAIKEAGYRVIGPRVEPGQGGLVYCEIAGAEDLPQGLSDEQSPGRYRLVPNGSKRYFAWANTASAIKPYVFVPRERLWSVVRKEGRLHFEPTHGQAEKTAIIGARACDLAALALQDAHFLRGKYVDTYYRARREKLLLVAVNCSHAASTCFCASTGDGPEVSGGYDILLDELDEGFIVRVGSSRGAMLMTDFPTTAATTEQIALACAQGEACRTAQTRRLPDEHLLPRLMQNLESPIWDDIAERCLACGNCTAVCPSCFCHREFDNPALNGKTTEHWRDADSCFSEDHSYLVGEVVREHTRARYRQWMTHKLATWVEQYGRTGCTGCGRCTTWCPAGIDFALEANRLLADEEGAR
ncbi:MAG: 4Fe-4S dicluster domain-containing protein [Uliginosibacterium sp.]|nr:4Fe-4S dicluster domain-containing protein [Uliginosibacterium sp.]